MSACTEACQIERLRLAKRLRVWYHGGRRGMLTVCKTEGTQEIKNAVERWYDLGWARLDEIAKELEQ